MSEYDVTLYEEENKEESEHKHDALVSLDGIIRCRTCGEILPSMEEILTKVQSQRRAKRILEEIAVAGKYRAVNHIGGFVIYSRDRNGLTEEVTARRVNEKEFNIVKTIISSDLGGEGGDRSDIM